MGAVFGLFASENGRWVLTWEEVGGARTAKARLVAKGYQDPDMRNGGICESQIVSFAAGISGDPAELADLDLRYQECPSPDGWLRLRGFSSISMRAAVQACSPGLQTAGAGVWSQ